MERPNVSETKRNKKSSRDNMRNLWNLDTWLGKINKKVHKRHLRK